MPQEVRPHGVLQRERRRSPGLIARAARWPEIGEMVGAAARQRDDVLHGHRAATDQEPAVDARRHVDAPVRVIYPVV